MLCLGGCGGRIKKPQERARWRARVAATLIKHSLRAFGSACAARGRERECLERDIHIFSMRRADDAVIFRRD